MFRQEMRLKENAFLCYAFCVSIKRIFLFIYMLQYTVRYFCLSCYLLSTGDSPSLSELRLLIKARLSFSFFCCLLVLSSVYELSQHEFIIRIMFRFFYNFPFFPISQQSSSPITHPTGELFTILARI